MTKEPNRAVEMAVFVRVVDAGDFSAAARALCLSPSAVSKLVSRLETRLGARLFRRSTRGLALTPEGEAFNARARAILGEIEAAEREAGGAQLPAGRIRISSSASYVAHVLSKILPAFLVRYPDVAIDIFQSDALSDLVADRIDVAIRAGALEDSRLIARSLGETPLIVVAAPAWIAHHGMPATLDQLAAHDRLGFAYPRALGDWLKRGTTAPERIRVSDGEGIRRLTLAGIAPARLACFTIHDDLAHGRLVQILPEVINAATEPFHAVYVGQSDMLPQRSRVFLDYLGNHGRVDERRE